MYFVVVRFTRHLFMVSVAIMQFFVFLCKGSKIGYFSSMAKTICKTNIQIIKTNTPNYFLQLEVLWGDV